MEAGGPCARTCAVRAGGGARIGASTSPRICFSRCSDSWSGFTCAAPRRIMPQQRGHPQCLHILC